jgi:ketosteroid isomerase-like protein
VDASVEIVRLGFERFNADDLQGFLELCDPEVEFHDVAESRARPRTEATRECGAGGRR